MTDNEGDISSPIVVDSPIVLGQYLSVVVVFFLSA